MSALKAQLRIEGHAERDQLADALRAFLDQDVDRARPAQLASGSLRVDGVQRSRVVIADRPRDPTLGVPAARIRRVALGQHHHAGAALGRGERCGQPGRAAPND